MGKNSRSILIREQERAKGNVQWAMQHITTIIVSYGESSKYYTDNNLPIPETYEQVTIGCDAILTVLSDCIKAIDLLGEIL